MAPFPAEVDVFSVPHSKMKYLVEDYLEKVDVTDFSNSDATELLLRNLHSTFCVFKSHERIENEFIMYKLKSRLKDLSVSDYDSLVCNCHSDNRMAEMLQLVQDGYDCSSRSKAERIRYGQFLKSALREFTGTFLPHMKEEEEIFQPMLIKYFEYEELKILKDIVLEQHEILKDVNSLNAIFDQQDDCSDAGISDEFEEKCSLENWCADQKPDISLELCEELKGSVFDSLPPELVLKVFSYLWPPDLGHCAQVSNTWNKLAYHPSLWSCIVPCLWARGIWDRPNEKYIPEEDNTFRVSCGMCVLSDGFCSGQCGHRPVLDEDADVDESVTDEYGTSGSLPGYDDTSADIYKSRQLTLNKERVIMRALWNNVLPKVGANVQYLCLDGCRNLDGKGLASIFFQCPNVRYLDLSYSNINENSVLHLSSLLMKGKSGNVSKLQHLDLSGCIQLTDTALMYLVNYFVHSSVQDVRKPCSNLSFLSLSGCSLITDHGIRCLFSSVSGFPCLSHLDLSGCWNLTSGMLKSCIALCPNLHPEELYYCDHISDGPHSDTANGCQNLGCAVRSCCCLGF